MHLYDMVLQRAPESAALWGWASPGATHVTAHLIPPPTSHGASPMKPTPPHMNKNKDARVLQSSRRHLATAAKEPEPQHAADSAGYTDAVEPTVNLERDDVDSTASAAPPASVTTEVAADTVRRCKLDPNLKAPGFKGST